MHFATARKLTKNAKLLIDKLERKLLSEDPLRCLRVEDRFSKFASARVLLLDLTKPLIMRVWWDYDLLLGKQVIANWIHFRKIRVSYHISLNLIQKITLKSHRKSLINFASEASYVYISNGQKFIENAKMGQFGQFLKNWS